MCRQHIRKPGTIRGEQMNNNGDLCGDNRLIDYSDEYTNESKDTSEAIEVLFEFLFAEDWTFTPTIFKHTISKYKFWLGKNK